MGFNSNPSRAPALQCVSHTFNVNTLFLWPAASPLGTYQRSSVPGTAQELAGETPYPPAQSISCRAQKTAGLVLSCQKPESTYCVLRLPQFLGSTSEHPSKECGPPCTPPAPAAGSKGLYAHWPSFNLLWLFPNSQPQPREAWCRL